MEKPKIEVAKIANRPGVIHYPLVRLRADTAEECRAFDTAIAQVLRGRANALPFHDHPTEGPDSPGTHTWEAYYTRMTEDEVRELLPEIERIAMGILERV